MKIYFAVLAVFIVAPAWGSDINPMADMRHHMKREINVNMPTPKLSLALFKDASNGYNLHLNLANYHIQPPELRQENSLQRPLEGHAHLYINSVKIGRLYGGYYHLPKAMFNAGVNNIKVTLNSHDHAVWAVQGKEVFSSIMINTLKDNFILYQLDTQAVK